MELIERLPLKPIQWLATISRSEFDTTCINKKTTKKDRDGYYTMLKQFCKTNIKTGGITTRIYSYSTNTPAGFQSSMTSSLTHGHVYWDSPGK